MPIPPNNLGAKMGFDKNGLYICVYNGHADLHKAQTCYAIPMADVVAAEGPIVSRMQTFADMELEPFPATDLDPHKAPDAPAALLNKVFGDNASKLFLHKITWSGDTASISAMQTIPLSKNYPTPNGNSRKFQAIQPARRGSISEPTKAGEPLPASPAVAASLVATEPNARSTRAGVCGTKSASATAPCFKKDSSTIRIAIT